MGPSNYHLGVILQEAVALQPLYDQKHISGYDPTCFLTNPFVVHIHDRRELNYVVCINFFGLYKIKL
jgi:hypothetical protein